VIGWPVLTALGSPVATGVAAGAVLIRARTAVLAGALLVVAAVLGAAVIVASVADAPDRVAYSLLAAAGLLALPLAGCAYPRLRWTDPVEFAAAVTVAGAGGVAIVEAGTSTEVTTLGVVSVLALIGLLWWRLERGPAGERVPLLWIGLAVGTATLVGGIAGFAIADGTIGGAVGIAGFGIVGPAMVIGVCRPDFVDVRGVLVQAVVLLVTLLLYVSVFVGVVATFQSFGSDDQPPIGALAVLGGICAWGFHPATVMLRGVIDQLLFGDRPDPLRAATQVVDRIGEDPVLALRAIREALVLPYASLRADGRELASSGSAVTHTRALPLALGGDSIGEIVVGLRAGDLRLAAADEHVLRIVAPLLAQTIRARAMAADLQSSRGEAIAAIEEERRRLRRDLHDGLGPTLTGVAFATDAARNKLRDDPSGADALLARLRGDTADAIAEIRRLVEGLRPPALDDLGLIAAIRQQSAQMHTAVGVRLEVNIDAPDPMPRLSAATEVAAYRIIVEALTNVARHACSSTAHVRLSMAGGELEITVEDAGAGGDWQAGVGMSSMRERAEQVGGTLQAGGGPDGGRVQARIPLT
jgi:two-component system NarL family sensor kinase